MSAATIASASDRAAVEERVLLVNYGGWIGEDDRDCVEANLAPIDSRARCIATGRTNDALLFVAVDGALRTAKIRGPTGLYLDENQNAVVASNDVDLRVSGAGAIISGDDHKA